MVSPSDVVAGTDDRRELLGAVLVADTLCVRARHDAQEESKTGINLAGTMMRDRNNYRIIGLDQQKSTMTELASFCSPSPLEGYSTFTVLDGT